MALFSGGFEDYLKSEKYSDLRLISESQKTEYKVHKLVLTYSSDFFARLLLGEFKEASQKVIELKLPDPANVFPLLLQFMYTGRTEINLKNAIPLMVLSDHYLVRKLKEQCRRFLRKNINQGNVQELLKMALEFENQEMIEVCSELISKSFFHIKSDFIFLPFELFNSILHHQYLAVKDEFELYKCICGYIEAYKNELSPDQIHQLMETVRFRHMPFDQLQECERNKTIPRKLLLQAIMTRLKKYELPSEQEATETALSDEKRIYCTTFEHDQDFDDRGVVNYLATSGGSEKWNNPHSSGKLIVTASSIEVGNVMDLFKKTPSELWTKDVPSSWFTIDFGPNKTLRPIKYTLRHGMGFRADSLRTWDFQGSTDGRTWVILKKHVGDTSLSDRWATHTWDLQTKSAFRYFRILQTGRNSSNHNFLVISGIELYGDLYEWQDDGKPIGQT